MKLQSFSPFPFNLQQFNQAACVRTWALLCALSFLHSCQAFSLCSSEDEMWAKKMKQEGDDFRFFHILSVDLRMTVLKSVKPSLH